MPEFLPAAMIYVNIKDVPFPFAPFLAQRIISPEFTPFQDNKTFGAIRRAIWTGQALLNSVIKETLEKAKSHGGLIGGFSLSK